MNRKLRMKVLTLIVMGTLSMGILSGCGGEEAKAPEENKQIEKEEVAKEEEKEEEKKEEEKEEIKEEVKEEPVDLVWWTIGNEPIDLDKVNEEISKYTLEKINATVEIRFASWGEYGEKLSKIVQSGEEYDIAFGAGILGYQDLANKNYFTDLTPHLDGVPALKDFIPEDLWQGMTINEQIVGVPAFKDSAQAQYWIWQEPIIEEFELDITQLQTLEDLDPVLREIKTAYPTQYPMALQGMEGINGFIATICGFDELLVTPYVGVRYDDDTATVVSPWDDATTMENLNILHQWYNDGIINPDAPTLTETPKGRIVASAQGFPHAWAEADGVPVDYQKYFGPAYSTRTIQGSFLVVSAGSENVEEALEVIELVNTDEYMRNLLAFGIEDVHYKKTGDTSIEKLNTDYDVPGYSQGTFFNMYTVDPSVPTMWQELQKENESAFASPALGFTFNTQPVQNQIAACSTIQSKYQAALITGAVDPNEIVPQMLEELNAAGYQEIITEAQTQLNTYLGK